MVELHFFFTGRFPIALMNEIARRKEQVYSELMPDLRWPNMLSGASEFTVERRRFQVLFFADQEQIDESSNIRPLRVIDIEELPLSGETG